MSLQKINLGATVGDKTGDGARTAGEKINANFDYLEDKIENRNKVVFNAGLTQDGNEILINAGWEWLINGVLYTNPVSVLIDVPVAASGLSRIDNIVATTSNTFARSEGTESETPVAPIFVPGTIVVAFALVNDTALQDSGNVDPEKLDRAGYNGNAATLDQKIDGTREDVMTRIDDAFDTIEQVDAKINNHFKGVYLTEAALIAAHPTANIGDYAQVNEVGATDVVNYNWDAESSLWVKNVTEGGSGANNTDELPEGTTNLYFTVARFLANLTYANIIAALGFTPSQAPNNAQKNSDITKAEIEAKLIGEITSHTHPNSGGGDMTTTTDQTVSGIKTYLAGKLGFRNGANTFTSFFSNSNTASRTYTFQNKDYTVADNADLAGKMSNPTGGIAHYLPKFLTATTMGLSRLWDTGSFLGIGTFFSPTKDITLGNQANRVFGVEVSDSVTVGRDLDIEAGSTINYALNINFNALNQVNRNWWGIAVAPNGDVYASVNNGDIYKQTGGTGSFVGLGFGGNYQPITVSPNGNIYVGTQNGDILMQTGGTGSFVGVGAVSNNWSGLSSKSNGDIYACAYGGDIYKRTGGTGSFVALGQTNRSWYGIAVAPNGDVYATVDNGDIYKQTGGSGSFVALGQTNRSWKNITVAPNGNVYVATGGDIYMQTGGTGNFIALGQTSRNYFGIASSPNGNIYTVAYGGDIYAQINFAVGTANLNGGAYRAKAGTGKGTGKSYNERWTGQKTISGTDMQVLTLRDRIDENGHYIYYCHPVYTNDAAADADTNLAPGSYYKITGNRQIFQKPI